MKVRVLFNVNKGDGMPTRLETAVQKNMKMPFPLMVGMDLLVDEDIEITICQVSFDDKTQQYSAYCEYDAGSKGEIEETVKRFVGEGWTHDPY